MKAIWLERTGGPEMLDDRDIPTPVPGPGQVLVKAHFIGVNMPEVLVRRGVYPRMPHLPTVPGIEMSGLVVAAGPNVRSLREGQAVYVSARELPQRAGCYAEYIAVDENVPYPLPEGIDLQAAATLASYQVAYHLLRSATAGIPFQSVLIKAAAGGVGTALVQLAKESGAQVIGLVRSEAKAEFVRAQGATVVIKEQLEKVAARVADVTQGRGVDLVLDPVGGARFLDNFELLAPLGLVVLFGVLDGPPPDFVSAMLNRSLKSPAVRVFNMHMLNENRETRRTATSALIELLAKGRIRPVVHDRLALAEATKAQTLLESGKVLGNLLLYP